MKHLPISILTALTEIRTSDILKTSLGLYRYPYVIGPDVDGWVDAEWQRGLMQAYRRRITEYVLSVTKFLLFFL
jgi:hypothetical protein